MFVLSDSHQVECFAVRFDFMLLHVLNEAAVRVPGKRGKKHDKETKRKRVNK